MNLPNVSKPRSLLTVYYGLTIFVSAFLLFQIQPLISKYILPWFGGGTAVWTTAMMFFQLLLLGGYAYAHYISKLSSRSQSRVHLVVIGVMLAWIIAMALFWQTPITPGPAFKPAPGGFPVAQVVWVLLASVGLPYFLLSTTSSLIQSWFSKIQHQESPYSFYVLSNTASLLALLSYPVLFEPNLTVKQQALFWSIGFVVFLLLVGGCAVILLRALAGKSTEPAVDSARHTDEGPRVQTSPGLVEPTDCPPTRKTYLFWISLAACASVMLLATTNQICQDVASIPFLWVLPLSLYLLSFVIAFNDHQRHFRGWYVILMLAGLGLGLWNLAYGHTMTILFQIVSNSALLFIVCLLCHSELYLHRPHPRYLTSFYLMLSIGGAVGGVFVNLVAPLIFKDFWEYNLALVYCAGVAVFIAYQSRGAWLYRLRMPVAVVSMVLAVFILILPVAWLTRSVTMERNFYGVLKVRPMSVESHTGFDMQHGAIVHGRQVSQDPYRSMPTVYFTEHSGVGLALKNYPKLAGDKPMDVGVIGLGVGTLSAYTRPGDRVRFYEIDPNVITAAWDKRYFTYLSDSKGKVEIVEGDGRLSLERELQAGQAQQYDIFVFDAFSGDSIPTHLVDEEAVQLYLDHLKPDGVLAFNISNRHINMQPVLATLAQHYGLESGYFVSDGKDFLGAVSFWVLMTRNQAFLELPEIAAARQPLEAPAGFRMWTDSYSNLFQVLR